MTVAEFRNLAKEKWSEHQEQVEVIKYCDKHKILVFAIPNGSNKSKTAAAMFKAEGLRAGVPDLFFPIPNKYYNGLFIEMKQRARKLKSGKMSICHTKISENQKVWMQELRQKNYEQ